MGNLLAVFVIALHFIPHVLKRVGSLISPHLHGGIDRVLKIRRSKASSSEPPLFGPLETVTIAVISGSLIALIYGESRITAGGFILGLSKILALAGLFAGTLLLIVASRHYALGLGGLLVSGFISILLATYAILVINQSTDLRQYAQTLFGSGYYGSRVDRPALILSILGFIAAALLPASQWSRDRRRVQPTLIAVAIALPSIAAMILPKGQEASSADVLYRIIGLNDPLILLSVAALFLVVPLQAVGAVGWVYFWSSAISRTIDKTRSVSQLTALAAWSAWLVLGLTRRLPASVGGNLSEWRTLRDINARDWVIAAVLSIGAACAIQLWHGLNEQSDAAATAYVATAAIGGTVAAVVGVPFFLLVVRETLRFEPRSVIPALLCLIGLLAAGIIIIWFGSAARKKKLVLGVIVCVAAMGLLSVTSIIWPGLNVLLHFRVTYHYQFHQVLALPDTNIIAAISFILVTLLGLFPVGLVLWFSFLNSEGDWRHRPESGLAAVLLPLFTWIFLCGAFFVAATFRNPFGTAFSGWPLPDPAAVAVVASVLTLALCTIRSIGRHYTDDDRRLIRGVFILSAAAFVPLAVPSVFRAGGHLALVGLALQGFYTIAVIVLRYVSPRTRKRNIQWQLGASALSIPLLAYAAMASGNERFMASGVVGDVGRAVAQGPLAHSRLIWILPLTVVLAAADRRSPQPGRTTYRQPVWRYFEAGFLLQMIEDEEIDEYLACSLSRHLAALSPLDRRTYAVRISPLLLARCRFQRRRESREISSGPGRVRVRQILDTSRKALHGEARPDEIQSARTTIASLKSKDAPRGKQGRLEIKSCLAETLAYALGDGTDSPDVLVQATKAEVMAAARNCESHKRDDDNGYERAMERFVDLTTKIFDDLPGRFTLFQDLGAPDLKLDILGLSPSLVLDCPPRRQWGLKQPYAHPYRRIAILLAGLQLILPIFIIACGALLISVLNHS